MKKKRTRRRRSRRKTKKVLRGGHSFNEVSSVFSNLINNAMSNFTVPIPSIDVLPYDPRVTTQYLNISS